MLSQLLVSGVLHRDHNQGKLLAVFKIAFLHRQRARLQLCDCIGPSERVQAHAFMACSPLCIMTCSCVC